MATREHPTPCIKCRWSNCENGKVICSRPFKARSCPVIGLEIIRVNKPAATERRGWRVWLVLRRKCGAAGRFFSAY